MLDVEILRPRNLPEAFRMISKIRGNFRYLAGGTDIVVAAKRGGGVPAVWVDISQISEMKRIEEKNGHIFIGGLATYAEISESAIVRRWAPSLFSVCPEFASPPVRSLATLGGNCANASPAGDGIPTLYAEQAHAVLVLRGRKREVPIEEFFLGPRKTILRPGEIFYGVKIPKWGHQGFFLKIGPRKGLAIAKASLGLAVDLNGKVKKIRIALGAVGPTVLRARETESYLCGKALTQESLREARRLIQEEVMPITDFRSTADYRWAMTGVLLERALRRAASC